MAFTDLFRKNKAKSQEGTEADRYQPAPGTSIRFDPGLIAALKQDHGELLGLYHKMRQALAAGDFVRLKSGLEDFRATLQAHLLTEKVRLYVYLSHQLQSDATKLQIVDDFRREMDQIGRTVMTFIRKYSEAPITPESVDALGNELEQIATALARRTKKEEEILYPMYQPQY